MSKVQISIEADEMPNPDFSRDVVIAIAKTLHDLYNGFGPCGRRAKINLNGSLLIGDVKFIYASETAFQLGGITFYKENGEWKQSFWGLPK
jgi:hypothetical protein